MSQIYLLILGNSDLMECPTFHLAILYSEPHFEARRTFHLEAACPRPRIANPCSRSQWMGRTEAPPPHATFSSYKIAHSYFSMPASIPLPPNTSSSPFSQCPHSILSGNNEHVRVIDFMRMLSDVAWLPPQFD